MTEYARRILPALASCSGQPVTFVASTRGSDGVGRFQLINLGIQAIQPVPVLTDRITVQDGMRRSQVADGTAQRGKPGHQIDGPNFLARVADEHREVGHPDAVIDQHTVIRAG